MNSYSFETPNGSFCITALRDDDVDALVRILNEPSVYMNLATPPFPYRKADAEWYINHCREATKEPQGRGGPPYIGIRQQVEPSEPPGTLLGVVNIKYDVYDRFPVEQEQHLAAENARRSPQDAQWVLGCYLDPAVGRQGIMSAAIKALIEQWFIPFVKPKPGQLVSSCYRKNVASRQLHRRCDFLPIAISPRLEVFPASKGGGSYETICMVWQGAGPITQEQSAYRDFPAFDEDAL